jgi:hypothetical protein
VYKKGASHVSLASQLPTSVFGTSLFSCKDATRDLLDTLMGKQKQGETSQNCRKLVIVELKPDCL